MLLSLLAAAIQSALPAPPSPPLITIPPASALAARPVATFQLRVTLNGEQLVSERLRVGGASAIISHTRQEALAGECRALTASLNRNLYVALRHDLSAAPDRYRLELRFSQPFQNGCNSGGRGFTLDQQFSLPAGQSLNLSGEGGLRVELRRES